LRERAFDEKVTSRGAGLGRGGGSRLEGTRGPEGPARRAGGPEDGDPEGIPPERISLRAIGEEWRVEARPGEARSVVAVERPEGRLLLFGDLRRMSRVREELRRWLAEKGRTHLEPRLLSLARDRDIPPPSRVSLRFQRSRWGSRSGRGTISLNLRLLFLPEPLVRYVLLHELAHVREMNHSDRFWAFLETLEPRWRELRAELRGAARYVPPWA
jgi:hypothetical protein